MTRQIVRLLAALTLGMASACNTVGGLRSTPTLPSNASRPATYARPASSKVMLYVSDPITNAVLIYRLNHESDGPVATIKRGLHHPAGIALAPNGTLYVANTGNDSVTAYAPATHALTATYRNDLSGPVGVALDPAGNLFVANFHSFVEPVVEFALGSRSPTVLRNPGSMYPIALTAQADASLDVAYDDFYGQSWVCRYPAGAESCHLRTLHIALARWELSGLVFDTAGNLLIANATLPGIEVFTPDHASPKRIIARRGAPRLLALGAGELAVSDTASNDVTIYSYPSGKLERTVTTGLHSAYGVAIGP